MRYRHVFGILALTTLQIDQAFAKPKPIRNFSWGKEDVSFEDYRRDAMECARLGANSDMTGSEAAKTVIRGVDRQDTDLLEGVTPLTVREYAFTAKRSRFKENVGKLQSGMTDMVHTCLSQKGYIKFSLSDSQLIKLSNLEIGSEERFRYMHALASDENILAEQR